MTDAAAAYLKAILAAPDDDAPRLAFADHLEEHGPTDVEVAHASFIRVQCELERHDQANHARTAVAAQADIPRYPYSCACDACSLSRRESELLADWGQFWAGGVLQKAGLKGVVLVDGIDPDRPERPRLYFRRGFVWGVRLAADVFSKRARSLFLAAPVERVTIPMAVRGVRPDGSGYGPTVFRGGGDGDLRGEHYSFLAAPTCGDPAHVPSGTHCHYETERAALQGVSDASVAYGRFRAGLATARA